MYLSVSRKYEDKPQSNKAGYFQRALERVGESYGGGNGSSLDIPY